MKKSTITTLILSIVSLVLSFVLKACAIAVGFQKVHYEGWGYSYTQIVVRHSALGQILSSFSQMTFILGIVLVCVFAYLAVKNPAERVKVGKSWDGEDGKAKTQAKVENVAKAEEGEVKAEVAEQESVISEEEKPSDGTQAD